MISLPKQLVVIGDSSVYGWGDNEGGGWCERLRKDWCKKQNGPVIYQLGVRGDGIEKVSSRWEKEWLFLAMRRNLLILAIANLDQYFQ